MALCPHVYRRGATYWWRRSFTVSTAQTFVISLSMRVRDPLAARRLGARLTVGANNIMDEIGIGSMPAASARSALARIVFEFAEDAFDKFQPRPRRADPPAIPYEAAQERAMLLVLGHTANEDVRSLAVSYRSDPGADDRGQATNVVLAEISIGFVYLLVGARGQAASVTDHDRVAMAARGLSARDIGFVEREVAFQVRHEKGTSWTLGPEREIFTTVMVDHGVVPTDANTIRLRRAYLQIYAGILMDAAARHAAIAPPIKDVLRELLRSKDHPQTVGATTGANIGVERERYSTRVSKEPDDQPVAPVLVDLPVDSSAQPAPSLAAMISDLGNRKVKAKRKGDKRGWTDKTAAQHLAAVRLFTKAAGTDDPRLLSQQHVGSYRNLLDQLPKNWGKSSSDAGRSIADILARCQDLDEDEVGMAGGTINRHLTQLDNILEEARGHGFSIGATTKAMRTCSDAVKRGMFTSADCVTLFSSATWTGPNIIHGSQYFVPLIGKDTMARQGEIVGLLIEDVDLDLMIIHIRPNRLRGVKSSDAIRTLPITSELVRLGFCEYIRALMEAGYDMVFPDLRLRGDATALTSLYYKEWVKILWAALPEAIEKNTSFHSWRKTANTALAGANVNDPLRCQIMGHAYCDVNGQHYIGEFTIAEKLTALNYIPVTTSHLVAHPIRLHPGLPGRRS